MSRRSKIPSSFGPGDRRHVGLAQARGRLDSVSSTACRSKAERLMTLSTSAVAVCCCSNSRKIVGALVAVRRSSRTFSMAITACAANSSSMICFSENGRFSLSENQHIADHALVLEQWHGEQAARTPDIDERPAIWIAVAVRLVIRRGRRFPRTVRPAGGARAPCPGRIPAAACVGIRHRPAEGRTWRRYGTPCRRRC